jgi:hypothetical protein
MGLPKGRPFLLAINLATSDSPGLASLDHPLCRLRQRGNKKLNVFHLFVAQQ